MDSFNQILDGFVLNNNNNIYIVTGGRFESIRRRLVLLNEDIVFYSSFIVNTFKSITVQG